MWRVATTPHSPAATARLAIPPASTAHPVAERNPAATAPRIAMVPTKTTIPLGSSAAVGRETRNTSGNATAAPQAAPTSIRRTVHHTRGIRMAGTPRVLIGKSDI